MSGTIVGRTYEVLIGESLSIAVLTEFSGFDREVSDAEYLAVAKLYGSSELFALDAPENVQQLREYFAAACLACDSIAVYRRA